MEANEREPGTWDECSQALQEFQWAHHKMGGAIAVRGFELEDDLAGRGATQSCVAEGRARDITTQAFEGVPLMGATLCVDILHCKTCPQPDSQPNKWSPSLSVCHIG